MMAQPPITRDSSTARRKRFGRGGCIALLVGLLLLVGAAGYLLVEFLGVHLPGPGIGQPAITTVPLHITFPYRGTDVTVVDARRSQSFADDPNSASDGMLRLSLQERNATLVRITWSYDDAAQLILPGKKGERPTYTPAPVDLAPGKTQSTIVDFAVPSNTSISGLVLRIGTSSEAQEDILLSDKVGTGVYTAHTSSLTGTLQYFGLNYSLKSATTSLALPGRQAARGMHFVTLALSVDNTLSQEAIPGSPYDYARLSYGNISASPVDASLPVSFDAGASGITGTITFLVPQKSTTLTLVLLPLSQDSGDQASANILLA